MALVSLNEILKDTLQCSCAVGAFGVTDYLMAEAVVSAAEELGTAVILMVGSLVHKPYAPYLIPAIAKRCENASVPVALHLDHGNSVEAVESAIRYGCSSVMYDGSMLPIEENIAVTRKVVEIASATGVSTEAEIGHVGGPEEYSGKSFPDSEKYTRPEDAKRFVRETGIDALAVAIGTVHGLFKNDPKLDFDRLKEIRKAVSVPLVLHGSTGLSGEDIRNAIDFGIKKVNVFTGMMIAAGTAAGEKYSGGDTHYPVLNQAAYNAAVEYVRTQIRIFNTPRVQE